MFGLKGGNVQIERVPTGIPGLDKLVEGGIPRGSVVLVLGSAGTGKTISVLQFLVNGAKRGEKGIYITFEQKPKDLYAQASMFGWDLQELEKQKKLKIVRLESTSFAVLRDLIETVKKDGYKNLVLDSITSIVNAPEDKKSLSDYLVLVGDWRPPLELSRKGVDRAKAKAIIDALKELGLTVLITGEAAKSAPTESKDEATDFAVDGVIILQHLTSVGATNRTLTVDKLRQTKIDDAVYPMEINAKTGVVIGSKETLYK